MSLPAGTKLGPYQIIELVGAGGMGEVYRARDERLGRDVAVKLLPPAFAGDADRLRRFEQEARAASQLNHPNIVAIYDIGTHEASPYVVSELLEGETLRQALERGPIPQRKAVEYARQTVSGLAAAHEKGIVHRDLKPENLFLTRDGRAKILDFGLAKLLPSNLGGGSPQGGDATVSGATMPGTVLGTAGYMSPEQVRGEPTDHRCDIFSFGAVFFEMLTGRRAFHRDSAVETMSAILKDELPELPPENRSIPPALEQIVRHCLEKKPEDRFQSARDLGFHLDAVTGLTAVTEKTRALVPPPPRRLWPVLAALSLLAMLAGAFLAGRFLPAPWLRGTGSAVPSYQQLTFRRGTVQTARFSPDGQTIFYGAAWDGKPFELFSTRAGSPESRTVLPEADLLSVSRQGELAVLLRRRHLGGFLWLGTLARVPISGGGPRELLEDVQFADWAPDGESLAVVHRVAGKARLEWPIGKVLHETAGSLFMPRFSPDGQSIAFLDHPPTIARGWSLQRLDLKTNKKTELFRDWLAAWGMAWRGNEIWVAASERGMAAALYAIRPDGRRRLLLRIPGTLALHDISPEGRVLGGRASFRSGIVGLAPGEQRERDLSWFGLSEAADLSDDGRTLLFLEQEGERAIAIYTRRTDGSPAVRLGEGFPLALTPDAKFAVTLPPAPQPQIVLLPTGPGETRSIVHEKIREYGGAAVFPGGQRLLFSGREQQGFRLYVQNLAERDAHPVTPEGAVAGHAYSFTLSPDGQWVAALAGDYKIRLFPIAGGTAQDIPGLEAGNMPLRWRDSKTLYVYNPTEMPARVYQVDVATGRRQLWRQLVPNDPAGVAEIGRLLLSADSQAYAYSYPRLLTELYLVDRID